MWGKHVQISKITITLFAKSRTSKKKCFEFTELEHQNVALTLVCYKCIACAVRNKVPLIFFCLFLFSHSLSGRQVDAVLPRHFTAIYYRCVDRVKESEDLTLLGGNFFFFKSKVRVHPPPPFSLPPAGGSSVPAVSLAAMSKAEEAAAGREDAKMASCAAVDCTEMGDRVRCIILLG